MKALIICLLDGTKMYLGTVPVGYVVPKRTTSGSFYLYTVLTLGQYSTSEYIIQDEKNQLYKIDIDTRELKKI